MRFIVLLVLALALSVQAQAQIQPAQWTETFTSTTLVSGSKVRHQLGAVVSNGVGSYYKYVRNIGVVCTIGDVVCYDVTNSVTQGGLFEVSKPATATLNEMAGVCMGALPATTGEGWIQIYGYNASINMYGATDILLGDTLNATNGQFYAIHGQTAGTRADYCKHILALLAYPDATAALKPGFIFCW